ncbi:MAG: class I SAM-dependent RNA methyltransferase [Sandaracinaceae bacterium]
MVAPHELFVSCAPGLEPLLARELSSLGALSVEAVSGGVRCHGHRALVCEANLRSGLASHVLVRVGRFYATRFSVLERELGELPFERFLTRGVPRSYRITARKSKLIHTGAIAERVARAVAKRLGDQFADPDAEGVPVQLRLSRDQVEVSIDTSGEPLHRRGYRLDPGKAPLREDLAHALVVASGWAGEGALVDPLCGSGTIPIEAAMKARGIAPGRNRSFTFEQTELLHPPTWARLREEADARVVDGPPILASDIAPAAVEAARANAERAGVTLALSTAPLSEAAMPETPGAALVTDPPHGRRLRGDAGPLYAALGRRIDALPADAAVAFFTAVDRKKPERLAKGLSSAFVTTAGGMKLRAMVRGRSSQSSSA